MKSDHAAVNQFQLILLCLAGWINRNQQNVIEYPKKSGLGGSTGLTKTLFRMQPRQTGPD